MAKPIIVLGAGGHAKVLLDALLEAGETVIGLLDPDGALHGTSIFGVPVLGSDNYLAECDPTSITLVNGVGSNGLVTGKRDVFETAKANGHTFAAVRHPTAVVGREATMGEGVQLLAHSVVETSAVLGDNVTINSGAIVNHDCQLDNHVHVAPGATVLGAVHVGEATHIGSRSVILPGLRIGRNCVIAAGAVVTREVTDGTQVTGVPARSKEE